MSGVVGEKIIGDKATISIGGSVFNLKLNFSLDDGGPATRSVNSSSHDYAYGAQDGGFTCEIEASTPDLSTIKGWVTRNSNGTIVPQTTIITLPPVTTGSTVTGTFSAGYHRYQIVSTSPDGFVLVRLIAVMISSNVTWA